MFQTTSDGNHYRVTREIESLLEILKSDPNNAMALELLVWDFQYTGYFHKAFELAERFVALDPLSANAQAYLAQSLSILGRDSEALATAELADQLGGLWAKPFIAYLHRVAQRDELAIGLEEAFLNERGLPDAWVRDLNTAASNQAIGQAYLDRRIPEIVATVPPERAFEMKNILEGYYLGYGYLDRYYDLIFNYQITSNLWGDAEGLISNGVTDRNSGFTAHQGTSNSPKHSEFLMYGIDMAHRISARR